MLPLRFGVGKHPDVGAEHSSCLEACFSSNVELSFWTFDAAVMLLAAVCLSYFALYTVLLSSI